MPRRDDLESILVIGSGPIVIGQACEFDYSGTQACRVLAEEGYRVVLANSNPATIMTDPGMADRTYVEPLDPDVLTAIIERERPDALLPTLGRPDRPQPHHGPVRAGRARRPTGWRSSGPTPRPSPPPRTASGSRRPCRRSACRCRRRASPTRWTRPWPSASRSATRSWSARATSWAGPAPASPGTAEALIRLAAEGLDASPISEVLVERSIAGQKEYELEVMRDHADNCVVICSIENFDPMGVHTGDSITVAPAQTLTDVEYQEMRDAAFACIRRVGVETGGSNVQFAVDPLTGHQTVIEMNPRVSRSSALASKATGFPIAKIAARLAVGYRLDEITNDITGATPASFEPAIDYVVTKIPRWAFEKLPGATDVLGTRMQSVGEVMGIGRTFPESLQKAVRSLEQGRYGLNADPGRGRRRRRGRSTSCSRPWPSPPPSGSTSSSRCCAAGWRWTSCTGRPGSTRGSCRRWPRSPTPAWPSTSGSPCGVTVDDLDRREWRRLKRLGFSDAQLAHLLGGEVTTADVRTARAGRRGRRSPSRPSTPARPSSRPTRPTTTRPTRTRTRSARRTGPG